MKTLSEFITESKLTVEIPKNIGNGTGTFYGWAAAEKSTYEEFAKYGDILAKSYSDNFGSNAGKTPNDRSFQSRIRKLMSDRMDSFAYQVIPLYVWAKLNGVDEKYILNVTVGLYNAYCSSIRGYKVNPITFNWTMDDSEKPNRTWSFTGSPEELRNVKKWVDDVE